MIYVKRETDYDDQSSHADQSKHENQINHTDQINHAESTDYAEEIRKAVARMNKELSEAVITAIETDNPVDGYRIAVDRIERVFEDQDAAMIEEAFKTSVLRILRTRVEGLMSDARRKAPGDIGGGVVGSGRDGRVTEWQDNGCMFSGCDPDECFTCEYTRGI